MRLAVLIGEKGWRLLVDMGMQVEGCSAPADPGYADLFMLERDLKALHELREGHERKARKRGLTPSPSPVERGAKRTSCFLTSADLERLARRCCF